MLEGLKCLTIRQLKQENEGISAMEPVMTRVGGDVVAKYDAFAFCDSL